MAKVHVMCSCPCIPHLSKPCTYITLWIPIVLWKVLSYVLVGRSKPNLRLDASSRRPRPCFGFLSFLVFPSHNYVLWLFFAICHEDWFILPDTVEFIRGRLPNNEKHTLWPQPDCCTIGGGVCCVCVCAAACLLLPPYSAWLPNQFCCTTPNTAAAAAATEQLIHTERRHYRTTTTNITPSSTT